MHVHVVRYPCRQLFDCYPNTRLQRSTENFWRPAWPFFCQRKIEFCAKWSVVDVGATVFGPHSVKFSFHVLLPLFK